MHRHGGVDWPSAERCEVCRLEAKIENAEARCDQVIDCGMPCEDRCLRGKDHGACKKHQHYWRLKAEEELAELRAENERLRQFIKDVQQLAHETSALSNNAVERWCKETLEQAREVSE